MVNIKDVDDKVVSAIGSAAGTVVDPRTGLKQLKSVLISPGTVVVAVGLVAYLLGRRRAGTS